MGNIASNQNPVVSGHIKNGQAQTPSKKYQASQDDACAICMDDSSSGDVTLKCGHQFHTACVKPWIHRKQTCPICRQRDTITFPIHMPIQIPEICIQGVTYHNLDDTLDATIDAAITRAINEHLSNNSFHNEGMHWGNTLHVQEQSIPLNGPIGLQEAIINRNLQVEHAIQRMMRPTMLDTNRSASFSQARSTETADDDGQWELLEPIL